MDTESDKVYYGKSAKELKPLQLGSNFIIQNAVTKKWDRVGNVVTIAPNSRKYRIKLPFGRCMWRNRRRRLLRNIPEDNPKVSDESTPKTNLPDAVSV